MPIHSKYLEASLFCDGACSNNPGKAGIGVVLNIKEQKYQFREYIGIATNNIAEYKALIKGLVEAQKLGITKIDIFTDSELMVKQLKGQYKVKNQRLLELYKIVISLIQNFKKYTINHISREENKEADKLASSAITAKSKYSF